MVKRRIKVVKNKIKIAVLPGDGIGPEIIKQAVKVLKVFGLESNINYGLIGGKGYEEFQDPLPKTTLDLALQSDAVLLGAVGDWKYDKLPRDLRPERGLLRIRQSLNLFANLRPAIMFSELIHASSLKAEFVSDLDIMIIRELTGDIYFGEPRGIGLNKKNEREGINTMRYSEPEIIRIANVAFKTALKRSKKLCSVDKANVLETTELWREIVIQVGKDYPEVELSHMYVDNAAMQMILSPTQFDVILTENMFGDIISDEGSVIGGSIGLLPSASIGSTVGLYEPIHGSFPQGAGLNIANPMATILSAAMLLETSLDLVEEATAIRDAVAKAIDQKVATEDLNKVNPVGTDAVGDFIAAAI